MGTEGRLGTHRTLPHVLPPLPRELRRHLSLHAMAWLLRQPPGTLPPAGAHVEVGAPRWGLAPTAGSGTGRGPPDTRSPRSYRRWADSWCWCSRTPCNAWCSPGTRRRLTGRWVLPSPENGCPHAPHAPFAEPLCPRPQACYLSYSLLLLASNVVGSEQPPAEQRVSTGPWGGP